ncbi:MAG: NAD(P)/FAD-dependent oxidoreductase [Caldilineaceae bacterium]
MARNTREDFLKCRRLSRIYYKQKYFYYPLRLSNALFGLGLWNSTLIFLSYLCAKCFPEYPENTFEQWVSNRFGKRLYQTFFKTYTEKVWGIPCKEISADWAAQRIKDLSLFTVLKNIFFRQNSTNKDRIVKTLIDEFYYPKLGPGMIWEKIANLLQRRDCDVYLNTKVVKVLWSDNKIDKIVVKSEETKEKIIEGMHFISSMPVHTLIKCFSPPVPDSVLQATEQLKYRDFLTVAVIIDQKDVFPDNWIYIHESNVKVGRIQNYKNWSPYMVPNENETCLGLEYFCSVGDTLWDMSEQELIQLGIRELIELKLIGSGGIVKDATVLKARKAYPVYDATYKNALQTIRTFLSSIHNLQTVGRNGMHKYNNQDHSMLTGILAAKNFLGDSHDLWEVNADQEYHEHLTNSRSTFEKEIALLSSSQPQVPLRLERH